jgi:glutamate formiminotransferase
VLECVVNVSEGRDPDLLAHLVAAAGPDLLDLHSDPDHHRSVLTLAGTDAPRAVAAAALAHLDLTGHDGVHPRIGVVDVVPFVPLADARPAEAVAARDDFMAWAGAELGVPCFAYGPLGELRGDGSRWEDWVAARTLPEVRRDAFAALAPDAGPDRPHPRAGAMAVGARPLLVAYNLWLAEPDLALARSVAREVRGPAVRALGLQVGGHVQVSMNLVDPLRVGPLDVAAMVADRAPVARSELVGLVPAAVLEAIPPERWSALDLGPDRTIEARLAARAAATP